MSTYIGQFITYAIFAAGIGLFSIWPEYRMLDDNEAIVSVTFSHSSKRIGACRELTQAELNELAPNMRKPNSCPRERHPTYLELRADGQVIFSDTLLPSGLWEDGKANVYHRSRLKAGTYEIFIGMNDSGTSEGFDFEETIGMTLAPGQNLVVGFDDQNNMFILK